MNSKGLGDHLRDKHIDVYSKFKEKDEQARTEKQNKTLKYIFVLGATSTNQNKASTAL